MGIRWVILLVGCSVAAGCTGASSSGGTTAPNQTSSSGVSTLPYGTVSDGGAIACPAGSGPPSNSSCESLIVSCPAVGISTATLRVSKPDSGTTGQGSIVLTTGDDGTRFVDSALAYDMIAAFTGDGLTVVQLRWDPPGIWGGPQARTLACRAATAMKWIYDHIHSGGKSRLFAAQGTSGGASQIAFGIGHYGVGDFLDLANLGGGPPICPLCDAGAGAPEPLLASTRFPHAINRDPLTSYPATFVHFFLGDQEPTSDIISDANAYFGVITSSKLFTTVPGTGHTIESTQAGIDAYVASVRSTFK